MSAIRRNPLYAVAGLLFLATVIVTATFTGSAQERFRRSGSVYDSGPGGAAVLRHWLDDLHASTRVLEGERFAPDPTDGVLVVLGASEPFTPQDVSALTQWIERGGTLVLATEAGFTETLLLSGLGASVTGSGAATAEVAPAGAMATGARALAFDVSRSVSSDRGTAIASYRAGGAAAMLIPVGSGRAFVVGGLAPFLSGQIGEADNGRFVLALVGGALRSGRSIAFDEFHHGSHPAPDVFGLLSRTWPGRTLVAMGLLVFAFLLLTGRRLGTPLPLEHRPARSSLEHVRAFAGLVRRSGHSEIARERLRRDLRAALARSVGVDPGAPLDRILGAVATQSPARAAEAREVDALLARPLRDADLVRTVRRIDALRGDLGA